jgi:DNA-directed RNA polymerase subunit RPC12/RpoP
MNFISWTEGPITGLELKYCERCGGLWLRLQGDSEVYCPSCRARTAAMPRSTEARRSNPRLPRPKPGDIQGQAQIKSVDCAVDPEARL